MAGITRCPNTMFYLLRLCGGWSLRRFITPASHKNLNRAAAANPDQLEQVLLALEQRQAPLLSEMIVDRKWGSRFYGPLLADLAGKIDEKIEAGRVLDLRPVDYPADTPEQQLYNKLRVIFRPENLAALAGDREIGDLALLNSLWQVRAMVYKAQYFRALLLGGSPSSQIERGRMSDTAESLLKYAGRFIAELHSEFPFGTVSGRQADKEAIGTIVTLFRRRKIGAIDASLVPLTKRLEADCEQHERARLRQERHQAKQPAALADSIDKLARTRYGINIGKDGIWKIPQMAFRSMGAVLRREKVAVPVAEAAVVRRTQHQIDAVSAEVARNREVISVFRAFCSAQPLESVAIDQALLTLSLETYKRGRVMPKVEAHLLIGLARDLLEVAGYAATIGELTPVREKLVKFSRTMLTIAVRQLERRNQALNNQLARLEVKKRILAQLVNKREERCAALKAAAGSLMEKLMDENCMADPENLERLRGEAIAAYRTIQNDKDLEAGLAQGKKCLADLISLTGELNRLCRAKAVRINTFNLVHPDGRPTNEARASLLEDLGRLNMRAMATRMAMVTNCHYFEYHTDHRFSADEPDEPARSALAGKISQLGGQQEIVIEVREGFVLKRDLSETRLYLSGTIANDNPDQFS